MSAPLEKKPVKGFDRAYRLKVPTRYDMFSDIEVELDDIDGLRRRIDDSHLTHDVKSGLHVLMYSEAKNIVGVLEAFYEEALKRYYPNSEIVVYTASTAPIGYTPRIMQKQSLKVIEQKKLFDVHEFFPKAEMVKLGTSHLLFPIRSAESCYGMIHCVVKDQTEFQSPKLKALEIVAESVNSYIKSSGLYEALLNRSRVVASFDGCRVYDISDKGVCVEVDKTLQHSDVLNLGKTVQIDVYPPRVETAPKTIISSQATIRWRRKLSARFFRIGVQLKPEQDHDGIMAGDIALRMKEMFQWFQRAIAKERANRK
ncbi:MAG: hypothetical protein NUW37_15905 [Planctomycetes bacterium]|nr:hypothetical protein [Planctomycetota bacterium]